MYCSVLCAASVLHPISNLQLCPLSVTGTYPLCHHPHFHYTTQQAYWKSSNRHGKRRSGRSSISTPASLDMLKKKACCFHSGWCSMNPHKIVGFLTEMLLMNKQKSSLPVRLYLRPHHCNSTTFAKKIKNTKKY